MGSFLWINAVGLALMAACIVIVYRHAEQMKHANRRIAYIRNEIVEQAQGMFLYLSDMTVEIKNRKSEANEIYDQMRSLQAKCNADLDLNMKNLNETSKKLLEITESYRRLFTEATRSFDQVEKLQRTLAKTRKQRDKLRSPGGR